MPSQEAERLLRIALFSDSLQLEAVEGQFNTIVLRRRELAKVIRDGRKKGIVPVFVSQTWFLFSLAITIESGKYGYHARRRESSNPTQPSGTLDRMRLVSTVSSTILTYSSNKESPAHNLALSLLMIYFPVLILCFIVDRNPTNADSIYADLNRLSMWCPYIPCSSWSPSCRQRPGTP